MKSDYITDFKTIDIKNRCPFCNSEINFSYFLTDSQRKAMNHYSLKAVLHCMNDACCAEMSLTKVFAVADYGFSEKLVNRDVVDAKYQLRQELGKRWSKWVDNACKMHTEIESKLNQQDPRGGEA